MNAEQWLKAVQLVVSLIQVVIWPGVLLFILTDVTQFASKSAGGAAYQ